VKNLWRAFYCNCFRKIYWIFEETSNYCKWLCFIYLFIFNRLFISFNIIDYYIISFPGVESGVSYFRIRNKSYGI